MTATVAVGAERARPATGVASGKLGIWWFLASEIMTFGGLIVCFILHRVAAGGWHEESSHVSANIAAFNTLLLVTSSLTIVQAHAAMERRDLPVVSRNLLYTILLGLGFLCMKAFEYSGEIHHGLTPASGLFWSFYYGMTGLHALHVLGGVLWNTALWVAALRGRLEPIGQRVEYAGLYWHFVDVVWIFLFPLIYLS